MKLYFNLGGNLNVVVYEIEVDLIMVEFVLGMYCFYLYDQYQLGGMYVENLKCLV